MTFQDKATAAEPGRVYPAWRDGRRFGDAGPKLHAVTEVASGNTFQSGFLALCGRPVRFPEADEFDPETDQACLECAVAVLVANGGGRP